MCEQLITYLKAPSVTDWIQAICALSLLVLAVYTINAWKSEKKFEAISELLNNTVAALKFVRVLRTKAYLETNQEIYENYHRKLRETEWIKNYHKLHFIRTKILEFKQPILTPLFTIIENMRAKAWSLFGDEDDFFKFYNRIIEINIEVERAHFCSDIEEKGLEENNYSAEERLKRQQILDVHHDTIYEKLNDDELMNELNKMVNDLESKRFKLR